MSLANRIGAPSPSVSSSRLIEATLLTLLHFCLQYEEAAALPVESSALLYCEPNFAFFSPSTLLRLAAEHDRNADHQPPLLSRLSTGACKALSEKAAFNFVETEKPGFTVTTSVSLPVSPPLLSTDFISLPSSWHSLAAVWILGHNDRPDLTWANAKESSSYGKTARLLLDPQPEDEKGAPAAMPGVSPSLPLFLGPWSSTN
jgi:hypothetical protein